MAFKYYQACHKKRSCQPLSAKIAIQSEFREEKATYNDRARVVIPGSRSKRWLELLLS